jgi:hypothetical protein
VHGFHHAILAGSALAAAGALLAAWLIGVRRARPAAAPAPAELRQPV